MRVLRRTESEETEPTDEPPRLSLGGRAEADLRFIRGTMERSGTFTAVPGKGGMAMGAVAVFAAVAAGSAEGTAAWLFVWGMAAAIAIATGTFAMILKARGLGVSLVAGPARRFLLCLCPALFAGAVLSLGLLRAGQLDYLPAAWLLFYGAGVMAAGAFSTRVVPLTGAAFLVVGAAAVALPFAYGNLLMGLGFGGIHLVSGFVVARHHGG